MDAFESEFGQVLGVRRCVAVCSGTAAMHLELHVLGVGPGDEVIASTLAFYWQRNTNRISGCKHCFCRCRPGIVEHGSDSTQRGTNCVRQEGEVAKGGDTYGPVWPVLQLRSDIFDLRAVRGAG